MQLVKPGQQERQVRLDLLEILGPPGRQVLLVQQDLQEQLVIRVLQVALVTLVTLGRPELLEPRAQQAPQVIQVKQDLQAQQVQLDLQVVLGIQAQLGLLVRQDQQDLLVLKEFKDQLVLKVKLALQDQQV